MPARGAVWLRALRAYSLPASLVPVVLGIGVAGASGAAVAAWTVPVVLLAGVLAHLGTNLINDAVDFVRGVDTPETAGGSGVLVAGWLSARAVRTAAYGMFAASGLIGLVFVAWRGWPLLAIGAVGLAGGYFYTAPPLSLKYRRLGEPTVFLLMGPLMAAGAAYAVAGVFPAAVWGASVPVGFLVTAILAANNLRDREDDRARGVRTVSNALGPTAATWEVLLLLWAAYGTVPLLVTLGVLPVLSLLCLLTVPLAVRLTRRLWQARTGGFPRGLVEQVAQLHLLHGLLLSAGPIALWLG